MEVVILYKRLDRQTAARRGVQMIAHDRAVQPAAQPRCSYALLLPVLDSLAPPAHKEPTGALPLCDDARQPTYARKSFMMINRPTFEKKVLGSIVKSFEKIGP